MAHDDARPTAARERPVTAQVSRDNPGWQGPGTPQLRTLGAEWRPIAALLRDGRYSASLHRAESALANAWNFHMRIGGDTAVECPCCGWVGPAFVATANWRALSLQSRCPRCDSRSRHRGLTRLLPSLLEGPPPGPVLIFAPELVLLEQFPRLTDRRIVTTDYLSVDVDYPGEDIQRLSFADGSFSLILCNHVLEHVPDDATALQECARVLARGGVAVFTIPGEYDGRPTWVFDTPDDNGHFRHYGLDVMDKMRAAFASVEAIDMGQDADPRWRIRQGDMAFVCRK
jgi:hypothetical protein